VVVIDHEHATPTYTARAFHHASPSPDEKSPVVSSRSGSGMIGGWGGLIQNWTTPQWLIGCPIVSLWVTLPQLAFALIGGFLFRMCWHPKRKQPSTPSPSEIQNSVMFEFLRD